MSKCILKLMVLILVRPGNDYLAVGLNQGHLVFIYELGSGRITNFKYVGSHRLLSMDIMC